MGRWGSLRNHESHNPHSGGYEWRTFFCFGHMRHAPLWTNHTWYDLLYAGYTVIIFTLYGWNWRQFWRVLKFLQIKMYRSISVLPRLHKFYSFLVLMESLILPLRGWVLSQERASEGPEAWALALLERTWIMVKKVLDSVALMKNIVWVMCELRKALLKMRIYKQVVLFATHLHVC